jgi:hypothetical protein
MVHEFKYVASTYKRNQTRCNIYSKNIIANNSIQL